MVDKHDVRKGIEVLLADGVTRTIRPLTIRQLRKFVKVIEKLEGTTEDATTMSDDDIDTMIEAASIILEKTDPNLAADKDALEDSVDVKTFNELMSIAMGAADPEE